MKQSIKLQTSAILHVPLDKYDNDFTFIVNGQYFKTSKIVADLLSSKISSYHSIDPTISDITINTHFKGDFQKFLQLQQFKEENISSIEEFLFIREIIKELGTEKVKIIEYREDITIENVIERIEKDEKYREIYFDEFENEVKFIAKHFSEIISNQKESFLNLSLYTVDRIINDSNLQLENEDELLKLINEFYQQSHEFSVLYESVCFSNVEIETFEEFINIFNVDDLNMSTWHSICECIKKGIRSEPNKNQRYRSIKFPFNPNQDFNGIFNFLGSNSNLNDEIKITASSVERGNLYKLIQNNHLQHEFHTKNLSDSWICFEFLKHHVILSNYTLRSNCWGVNYENLKNWALEGSNDSLNWVVIDSQTNCSYLNGQSFVHTFHVKNDNNRSFKFFRIHQTGRNCGNSNYLCFNCIEIFGRML